MFKSSSQRGEHSVNPHKHFCLRSSEGAVTIGPGITQNSKRSAPPCESDMIWRETMNPSYFSSPTVLYSLSLFHPCVTSGHHYGSSFPDHHDHEKDGVHFIFLSPSNRHLHLLTHTLYKAYSILWSSSELSFTASQMIHQRKLFATVQLNI